MKFPNRTVYDASTKGFGIHEFIMPFNDTFHKSSYYLFKNFILNPLDIPVLTKIILDNETKNRKDGFPVKEPRFKIELPDELIPKKWIIISDYAFGNKPQDVVSFVLIPYIFNYENLIYKIKSIQPKDIKKSSHTSDEFIELLNSNLILSVSISLNKKMRLCKDEKGYFLSKLIAYIKMIESWIQNEPEKENKYREEIKSLDKLKCIISTKGVSKQVRQIEIVSTLVTYLMIEITKLIPNVELIGWFSDRDAILDYKEKELDMSVIQNFVQTAYHVFCEELSYKQAKIVFAKPESSGTVWYDELIRLPDFIAGALADYDTLNNKLSHEKFIPLIEKVFTNEKCHLFFGLRVDTKTNLSMECVRLSFSPK